MSARQRREVVPRQKASHEKFLLPAGVGFFILIICAFFLIANPFGLITSTLAIILLAAGMGLGALVFGGAFFRVMGEIRGEARRYEAMKETERFQTFIKALSEVLNDEEKLNIELNARLLTIEVPWNEEISEVTYRDVLKELKEGVGILIGIANMVDISFLSKDTSVEKIKGALSDHKKEIQNEIKNADLSQASRFVRHKLAILQNLHGRLKGIARERFTYYKAQIEIVSIESKSRYLTSRLSTFGLIVLGLGGIFLVALYPITFSFLIMTVSILTIAAGVVGFSLSYYFVDSRVLEEQKRIYAGFVSSREDDYTFPREVMDELKKEHLELTKESPPQTPPLIPTPTLTPKSQNGSEDGSEGRLSNPSSDVSFRVLTNSRSPSPVTPVPGDSPVGDAPLLPATEGLPKEKESKETLYPKDNKFGIASSIASTTEDGGGSRVSSKRNSDGLSSGKPSPLIIDGRLTGSTGFPSAPTSKSSLPPSPLILPRRSSLLSTHVLYTTSTFSLLASSPLQSSKKRRVKSTESSPFSSAPPSPSSSPAGFLARRLARTVGKSNEKIPDSAKPVEKEELAIQKGMKISPESDFPA